MIPETVNLLASHDTCTGCSACLASCSVRAIEMRPDDEGFLFPWVDAGKCTLCGRCHNVCPVLKPQKSMTPELVLAAFSTDKASRLRSSSGGVFPLLAERVVGDGGIVVGAAWTSDFRVEHLCVDALPMIDRLRGSKYVQSEMGEVFRAVRGFLESGRTVLFTGTPCQVGGLKSYMGREFDNLFCVDLICHGVPSPGVFSSVLAELESSCGGKCQYYDFRSKSTGWRRCSVVAAFDGGGHYSSFQTDDVFSMGFLNDLYNRPSCASCHFRNLKSGADMTLADYWRVNLHFEGIDDNAGTSIILVNTAHGKALFEKIRDQMELRDSTMGKVKAVNPAVYRVYKPNRKRNEFFARWKTEPVLPLIQELIAPSLCTVFVLRIRRLIYKCRGKLISLRRSLMP